LAKDLDVSLLSLEQWNAMAEKISPHIGVSDTVYVLVRRLIENGLIKSYKQISRKLIQIILRDSKTVNKFAHFILPYVKELPEEIKSKVTDQKVLKPDWRKVNKFDESFSSFFKKK
jgi:predicted transcriptional regulator